MIVSGFNIWFVKSLSAFAARKAVANVAALPEVTSHGTHKEKPDDKREERGVEDETEVPERPKKRKRTQKTTRVLRGTDQLAHHENSSNQFSLIQETDGENKSLEIAAKPPESASISDTQQDSIESEDHDNTILYQSRQLCNFEPSQSKIVSETDHDWTVRLADDESITLIGQYDLWVRKGIISLYGAILPASSKLHRVYAPSTHALPVLRPIANPYGRYSEPAEIRIISAKSRLRLLKDVSPEFGRLWNTSPKEKINPPTRSFALVKNSGDDYHRRQLSCLNLPIDWLDFNQEFVSRTTAKGPSIILVCGPKGSGKSTYCRVLTNAIISKSVHSSNQQTSKASSKESVALLDADPGQPEFSLPGQLSLSLLQDFSFGPPFTHPVIDGAAGNKSVKIQSFGSLTPRDDPSHYLDCVLDLYETYRNIFHSHRHLPLVINSSGWIQGGGLDLLVRIIRRLDVSDVVYLDNDNSGQEDVPSILTSFCSKVTTNFRNLSSPSSDTTPRTAAEFRTMQTLSYFHLTEPEAGNLRWNYQPLQDSLPLVLHYAGPQQAVLSVMILGDAQDPNLYETILTGSLVDILLIDSSTTLPTTTDEAQPGEVDDTVATTTILRTPTSQIPYIAAHPPNSRSIHPIPPQYAQTLGQALIRSIDTYNKQIHLLIPPHLILPKLAQLDSDSLKERIVLLRGRGNAPTWAYEESLHQQKARRERRKQEHQIQLREMENEEEKGEGLEEQENEGPDLREMVKDMPWASVVEDGRTRNKGGRKRKGGRRWDIQNRDDRKLHREGRKT